jgi:hypothetical protein
MLAPAAASAGLDGEMEAKRKQSSGLDSGVSSDADVEADVAAVDTEFMVPAAAVTALPISTVPAEPGEERGQGQELEEATAAAADMEEKAKLELEEQLDAVHAQVLSSQVRVGPGGGGGVVGVNEGST